MNKVFVLRWEPLEHFLFIKMANHVRRIEQQPTYHSLRSSAILSLFCLHAYYYNTILKARAPSLLSAFGSSRHQANTVPAPLQQ